MIGRYCALMILGMLFASSMRASTPDIDAVKHCKGLTSVDFRSTIDALTEIDSTEFVPAEEKTPAYCAVRGHVAPTVGFFLALPSSNFNGSFLEVGCGGFCGGTFDQSWLREYGAFIGPLRKGYAFLLFDGGHATSFLSASWAYNNLQAQFDFGIRAPHVAAIAGQTISQLFYGHAPAHSYFSGCSTGGQQALSEAQRFPWDFDGIIAGAPSPTFSGPMMYYLWAGRALAGTVNQSDLKLVHERALSRCDLDDGIKDGVIGDPLHCKFDPAELLCRAGQKGDCLTAAQVSAVQRVYSGPTTSKGEKLYSGGPLPGSELNWETTELSGAYVYGGQVAPWAREYFSYVGFMPAPGPSWKVEDFDFDRDYKRLRMAESLFGAADNPDLRKFKTAGGKLLMYQGGADQSDIPTDSVDYYETVEKTMGGRRATQDFFRLFLVPGMDHCTGGEGAYAIDYLTYLETWVESGQAPDKIIGAHVNGLTHQQAYRLVFPLDQSVHFDFTRPVYPYPIRARYVGKGDPNDALNFIEVVP